MSKEILDALKCRDDSKLYHELYDVYDNGSGEAVEIFEQWKMEVEPYGKYMIEKALQSIYDNESAINRAF